MARTLSARPMCSPAATLSRPPALSRASTTALPRLPGQSGIPEVPISGLPSPPSSPPLAAITSSNELALTPNSTKHRSGNHSSGNSRSRRGGATLRIREGCERFFCETMMAVFLGERNSVGRISGLTGVYQHQQHHHDSGSCSSSINSQDSGYFGSCNNNNNNNNNTNNNSGSQRHAMPDGYPAEMRTSNVEVVSWMEIWDYQGGASFRAFVTEDIRRGEKSLFVFFDAGIIGRELKQALVALIELAETPLGCTQIVIAIDRSIAVDEAKALKKGLAWAGFTLTTLEYWAGALDVTSRKWLFMGMEV